MTQILNLLRKIFFPSSIEKYADTHRRITAAMNRANRKANESKHVRTSSK